MCDKLLTIMILSKSDSHGPILETSVYHYHNL